MAQARMSQLERKWSVGEAIEGNAFSRRHDAAGMRHERPREYWSFRKHKRVGGASVCFRLARKGRCADGRRDHGVPGFSGSGSRLCAKLATRAVIYVATAQRPILILICLNDTGTVCISMYNAMYAMSYIRGVWFHCWTF